MIKRPVPAKVTPPQSGDSYPRKRLFKWLDHARRRPLIWVMGPPGSGKTTLLSDYLKRRRLTTLWYQVDSGDNDIATFFHYLDAAARKAAPRTRRPLPRFTPDRLGDLDRFAQGFFSSLYARLKRPFAIVLDNYQDVPDTAGLHEVLRRAVEALPAGGHIAVLSRAEPPASLARARLNQSMSILDDAALRLTLDEAQGIARHRTPGHRARQQISSLHELTHGWAAGLVLMLEQTGEALTDNPQSFKTPGVLFEYFANEVFAKADADTRAVLLKSVFLPTMTVRAVAELTGERRAGRILNHLSRNNFFTLRYDLPEPVFQYHPLFREFLLSRARRLPATDLTELRQRAATILERDGAHESALARYEELRDWAGFERCLRQLGPGLLSQGRHQALALWLERLPPEHLAHMPWLLYYAGVCRMPHHPVEGRQYFQQAHEQFQTRGDHSGLLASWNAIIDSYVQDGSSFQPLPPWIEAMERILATTPSFPSPELEAQTTCAMFVARMYGRPDEPGLPAWADRTERILRTTADLALRTRIAPHLLRYLTFWNSDLPRAQTLLNGLRPAFQSTDVPPANRIAWHAMTAAYYWLTAEPNACLSECRQGLDLADAFQLHCWDTQLCVQGVLATLVDNQTEPSEPFYARLDSLHNPVRDIDSAWYYYLQAMRHFSQNDLPRARQYLELAHQGFDEAAFPIGALHAMNDLARVMYYQGEHAPAHELLHTARARGRNLRSAYIEHLTEVTEAELALLGGDEAACLGAIRNFLAIASRQRFHNCTGWRSELMARLYTRALEHGVETDHVLAMIRQHVLQPPEEARETDAWPFACKIYTFGRFALTKDGTALVFSGKAQSKPLDLLKVLIALGGRQVSTVHLAETLWPEADGDAAQRTFDTTLHRLRRLLGNDQALLLTDARLSLNPAICWVDTWAFERLIGRLDLLLKQPHPSVPHAATITDLAGQLARLHRGPFLGRDTHDHWAIAPRERLQNRLLMLLGAMGRYWETVADWERAAEIYHRAIDVHAHMEEYYQRLMQAYRQLGRPADVAAVYQRCRETLLSTVGRTPSAATEALRHN